MTPDGRPRWRPGQGRGEEETAGGSDPGRPGEDPQHAGGRGHTPRGPLHVVLDLRPLQDPERGPVTAVYLDQLLGALDAEPRQGETYTFILATEQDDPGGRWPALAVSGRRRMPPTRLLRSGALTIDPILLRGAALAAGWHPRGSDVRAVYHATTGALPIASGMPIAAAVLDLAPWALPAAYQRGTAARFGQRIRGRLLRDAAVVLAPGQATAAEARQLLHVRAQRIRVVPLAARAAFRPDAAARAGEESSRLGLGDRYAVYAGRYDARQDLPTLLAALARLAAEPRPGGSAGSVPWPPRVCLVGATPDDRAALSRAAARAGVADAMAYAPDLPADRLAALVAGARFLVQPVRSEGTGLAAIEAIAAGVPVVASAVGILPEVVAGAGILVDPGDEARLARALKAAWVDDELHAQLVAATGTNLVRRRTWADVAHATRSAWQDVARPARLI